MSGLAGYIGRRWRESAKREAIWIRRHRIDPSISRHASPSERSTAGSGAARNFVGIGLLSAERTGRARIRLEAKARIGRRGERDELSAIGDRRDRCRCAVPALTFVQNDSERYAIIERLSSGRRWDNTPRPIFTKVRAPSIPRTTGRTSTSSMTLSGVTSTRFLASRLRATRHRRNRID